MCGCSICVCGKWVKVVEKHVVMLINYPPLYTPTYLENSLRCQLLALALILAHHLGRVLAHSHFILVLVVGRAINLLGDLDIAAIIALQAGQQDGIWRWFRCLVTELCDTWILNAYVVENLRGRDRERG